MFLKYLMSSYFHFLFIILLCGPNTPLYQINNLQEWGPGRGLSNSQIWTQIELQIVSHADTSSDCRRKLEAARKPDLCTCLFVVVNRAETFPDRQSQKKLKINEANLFCKWKQDPKRNNGKRHPQNVCRQHLRIVLDIRACLVFNLHCGVI